MLPTTPPLQERTDKELGLYCLSLFFLGAGAALFVTSMVARWLDAASDMFVVTSVTLACIAVLVSGQLLGAMNNIRSRINKEASRGVETG